MFLYDFVKIIYYIVRLYSHLIEFVKNYLYIVVKVFNFIYKKKDNNI